MRGATVTVLLLGLCAPALGAQSTRDVCFGVSFDRYCDVMVQYEVGYRFAVVGTVPRSAGADSPPAVRPLHGAFVAGGLMYSRSPGRAVGVMYEVGRVGRQMNYALGFRSARDLGRGARVDLTAGAIAKRVATRVEAGQPRYGYSPGAFAEATWHGTNYFSLTVRDELQVRTAGLSSAHALMLGARVERGPAVVVTAAAGALFLLANRYYGRGW